MTQTIINFKNETRSLEEFENIFFFKNGTVIGEADKNYLTEPHQENTTEKEFCSHAYGDRLEKITINCDVKRALKLETAINKNNAFFIKARNGDYFEKSNDLYIPADAVNFEDRGEHVSFEADHQTHYKNFYRLTFDAVVLRTVEHERIECDNYKLQDGENFGDWSGPDKEHAQVHWFEYEEHKTAAGRVIPAAHGIVKSWLEHNTINNYSLIVCARGRARIEYDDYRTKTLEKAAELKNAGLDYSFYDLERLNKAGFDIVKLNNKEV